MLQPTCSTRSIRQLSFLHKHATCLFQPASLISTYFEISHSEPSLKVGLGCGGSGLQESVPQGTCRLTPYPFFNIPNFILFGLKNSTTGAQKQHVYTVWA